MRLSVSVVKSYCMTSTTVTCLATLRVNVIISSFHCTLRDLGSNRVSDGSIVKKLVCIASNEEAGIKYPAVEVCLHFITLGLL